MKQVPHALIGERVFESVETIGYGVEFPQVGDLVTTALYTAERRMSRGILGRVERVDEAAREIVVGGVCRDNEYGWSEVAK